VSEVTRHVGHVRGGAGVEEPLRGAGWCAAGARGLKRYHQGGGVPGGWRGRWRAGEGHLILGRHGLLVVDGRARAQDAGTGGPKRQRPRLDKAGPRVVAGGPGELGGRGKAGLARSRSAGAAPVPATPTAAAATLLGSAGLGAGGGDGAARTGAGGGSTGGGGA
jgi:hypothetical protein